MHVLEQSRNLSLLNRWFRLHVTLHVVFSGRQYSSQTSDGWFRYPEVRETMMLRTNNKIPCNIQKYDSYFHLLHTNFSSFNINNFICRSIVWFNDSLLFCFLNIFLTVTFMTLIIKVWTIVFCLNKNIIYNLKNPKTYPSYHDSSSSKILKGVKISRGFSVFIRISS